MNSKTVTIEAPEGFKIDAFDKATGKVTFAPIPKAAIERIKNFNDVLEDQGISTDAFADMCNGLTPDEIAYKQLKLIALALNEGWQPDWTNGNWDKYYAWFTMGGSSGSGFAFIGADYWNSLSYAGSRLCFKTRELAVYAGETFTDIYKQFLTL